LETGDEEDEEQKETDGDALLRDFQYQIKCQFMERGRNLRVARIRFTGDVRFIFT
jgi:hypothetical protein